MRLTPGDWLLAREEDAQRRLDCIRRAVLAPERATAWEAAAEVFRPHPRFWASMALVWLILSAVRLAVSLDPQPASNGLGRQPDLAALTAFPDEDLSTLDPRS